MYQYKVAILIAVFLISCSSEVQKNTASEIIKNTWVMESAGDSSLQYITRYAGDTIEKTHIDSQTDTVEYFKYVNNRLYRQKYFLEENRLYLDEKIQYNTSGHMEFVKRRLITFEYDTVYTIGIKNKYNDQHQLVSQRMGEPYNGLIRSDLYYNSDDSLAKRSDFDLQGGKKTTIYKYGKDYNSSINLAFHKAYLYDAKGRLIIASKPWGKTEYHYEADRLKIKKGYRIDRRVGTERLRNFVIYKYNANDSISVEVDTIQKKEIHYHYSVLN